MTLYVISKILICAFIVGGVLYFLIPTLVNALKTGRIGHTNSEYYCDRVRNPIGFWALFSFFFGYILLSFYVLAKIIFHL